MPSLGYYNRRIYQRYPRTVRGIHKIARFGGRLARNPITRNAFIALEAARLARRTVKDIRRARATKRYREVPFTTSRPNNKKQRTAVGASSKVRWNVAKGLRKVPKTKKASMKVPKSVINSYKEYGLFEAKKMMYISHQHFGSANKFWSGIAHGLTKLCLAHAKVYPAKNLNAACIGPRTNPTEPTQQFTDKAAPPAGIRFCFVTENGSSGETTRSTVDVDFELLGTSPDTYRSFTNIANDVETMLRLKYDDGSANATWLQEAYILGGADPQYVQSVYIQNLDDAEIHLYCHSILKLQNVTTADHGDTGTALDQNAIDANPLIGRIYQAKGHHPVVDGDITQMTRDGLNNNRDLDEYFAQTDTTGITLHGHQTLPLPWASGDADELLGYISHIPNARALYGNQTVKTGSIYIKPGKGRTLKTSFSFKKTFRQLAHMGDSVGFARHIGMHTLIGLKCEHRHGEDDLKLGYNRDTDVGCFIKYTRNVYPLKMAYTTSKNQSVDPLLVPVEHAET